MKKFLVSLLVVAVVGGGVAWSKRADIILALAKYKASQKYADVAPTREIPWQQGPAEAAGEGQGIVTRTRDGWLRKGQCSPNPTLAPAPVRRRGR